MNIYFGIKYHQNLSNKRKIEEIIRILEKEQHQVYCVIRDLEVWGERQYTEQQLMKETFREIDKSDAVLIEFTEKGTGLGIEAGYAYARNKPIIVIAEEGSDISTTMKGIIRHTIIYKDIEELESHLIKQLRRYDLAKD